MLLHQLRQLFLQYYVNNSHTLVESSNLVPTNDDDTLLFTNSGMVQFKNIFTGVEKSNLSKATSVQKCIRAGGKHNDLDNVGYTARHHTFFEMLGNFSFGNYFKEQAIYYAWDFITNTLKIDKSKLCVTVYHTDDESFDLWQKISGLNSNKIIKINSNDNFWSMGDSGPCGPCSEIFYDYGEDVFGGPPGSKDENGDRFVEIWNLVFMQFNKLQNGNLINLEKKSIDTGMGLERLSSVMQNKTDNYDTDIFVEIINFISNVLKVKVTKENKHAFKVIADHLRSIAFLIAENIVPSNEGRGYVLRRIIRRAIRYAYFLGAKEPVLHKIAPSIISVMGGFYVELNRKKEVILNTIYQEEVKFFSTFANGIMLLNKEIERTNNTVFSGYTAFKLYDTFGFPVDLTENILQQHNILLNKKEFDKAFNEHKELAKNSWQGGNISNNSTIWATLSTSISPTEFTGYVNYQEDALITALLDENLNIVDTLKAQQYGYIILNKTPFYATMGGQLADEGELTNTNFTAKVIDVTKHNNIISHKIMVVNGTITINKQVNAVINANNRNLLSKHHTAAHLLQAALIKILGNHITQQGSSITKDKLRFDFSHQKPITLEEITKAEELINNIINQKLPIIIKDIPTKQAIEQGALAMFSEKYPEIARTVKIEGNNFISFELCGGTHVNNTAEIGVFKILSESSVSSGVRRIEAVCSTALLNSYNNNVSLLQDINKIFNSNNSTIISKIADLNNTNKLLKNNYNGLINKYYNQLLHNKFVTINNKNILCETLDIETIYLKEIANLMLQNKPNTVIALFNSTNINCNFVISISKDLATIVNLKEITQQLKDILEGSGGGSNTFVQGGGNNKNLARAIDLIKSL